MEIHIMGLGAIGSNLLLQLSRQLPDNDYVGWDYDKVEARNIPIQAYYVEHVNAPKALAMMSVLARYNRKPKYRMMNKRVEETLLAKPGALVVDCFDNTASRSLLKAADNNLLHIGFSPSYTAECIWDDQYSVPNDIPADAPDICQLRDAVGFIHFVVNLSVMVISDYLATGVRRSFIVTGKNKVRWL